MSLVWNLAYGFASAPDGNCLSQNGNRDFLRRGTTQIQTDRCTDSAKYILADAICMQMS